MMCQPRQARFRAEVGRLLSLFFIAMARMMLLGVRFGPAGLVRSVGSFFAPAQLKLDPSSLRFGTVRRTDHVFIQIATIEHDAPRRRVQRPELAGLCQTAQSPPAEPGVSLSLGVVEILAVDGR